MIQELKRTPITFNGVDGWEVMVLDDDLRHGGIVGCDKCIYDYNEISRMEDVPCPVITGCWYDDRVYFEFEPMNHAIR